jgi:hypothetical protein
MVDSFYRICNLNNFFILKAERTSFGFPDDAEETKSWWAIANSAMTEVEVPTPTDSNPAPAISVPEHQGGVVATDKDVKKHNNSKIDDQDMEFCFQNAVFFRKKARAKKVFYNKENL